MWQIFALVEACLQFGVGNVACHDDGAVEAYARCYRILGEFGAYGIDALVEIDLNSFATLAGFAILFGDKLGGIVVHFLNPDTVFIDFSLDVTVGRARYSHADGAACTVAWQADNANIVSQILAAELCSKAYFVGLDKQFLLQIRVTEGASSLISRRGQVVIILDATQFHGEKILFSRRAADDKADVIGWAGSGSKALHLLDEEGKQRAFVLNGSLCHGVEIGLVGRTATLCHHDEAVFSAFGSLDVDLRGQVAFCVYLVIHVERGVLRVAEIVAGVRIVHAAAKCFLVVKVGPDALSFLSVDDCSACILAEWEHTLNRNFRIAQELQGYVFIVFGGFGVG